MPNLMLYLVAISALTAAAALVVEHACAALGRPRRLVWLAALLVSFALPACAILAARGSTDDVVLPARTAESATPAETQATTDPVRTPERADDAALSFASFLRLPFLDAWNAAHATRRAGVDDILIALWIGSSAAIIALYGIGLAALHRAARRWPRRRLAHGDVLVSERLGPAIFGLVRPRVVVPSWLLETPPEQQALVLRHEREHAAARDPLLVAAALLMVALAP